MSTATITVYERSETSSRVKPLTKPSVKVSTRSQVLDNAHSPWASPPSSVPTRSIREPDVAVVRSDDGVTTPAISIQRFDGITDAGSTAPLPGLPGGGGDSMSKAMLNREKLYFIACCIPLFLSGWSE